MVCRVKKIPALTDLASTDLSGKRVLLRVDFNVPISKGIIQDDTRIQAALPTINHLINHHAKVILVSHLGRPKERDGSASLEPIANHLASLVSAPVTFTDSAINRSLIDQTEALQDGAILCLDNIRYYPEETANDPVFSKALSRLADLYVNDAFGAAHRSNASTEGVAHYLPSYAGVLLAKEIHELSQVLNSPDRPVAAIIGGAKVSTKFGVLRNLLGKVDALIVGGGMAFTFFRAKGLEIGKSLVEPDLVDQAREFLAAADDSTTELVLPVDQVVATEFSNTASAKVKSVKDLSSEDMGLDIGPKSIELFQSAVRMARTIIWNGPLGVFEMEQFSKGTKALAQCLATHSGKTIVGGGDSVAAINQLAIADQFHHVSTGGGASLEFLEGEELPGIRILKGMS